MKNIFEFSDFALFLKDELSTRSAKNPKYSLRAFSRDLMMSSSRLSEVLSYKGGLSMSACDKIAENLKLSNTEKEYFKNLVLMKFARSKKTKSKASKIIKDFKHAQVTNTFKQNNHKLVSSWFLLPLIELLTINQKMPFYKIAKILNISEAELTAAIHYLESSGFITQQSDSCWRKNSSFIKIESVNKSVFIREFHKALIERSILGMNQPIESRKYLSTVMSIKKENLPAARLTMERFNQKFVKKYSAIDSADSVYCFCLQLFGMEQHDS